MNHDKRRKIIGSVVTAAAVGTLTLGTAPAAGAFDLPPLPPLPDVNALIADSSSQLPPLPDINALIPPGWRSSADPAAWLEFFTGSAEGALPPIPGGGGGPVMGPATYLSDMNTVDFSGSFDADSGARSIGNQTFAKSVALVDTAAGCSKARWLEYDLAQSYRQFNATVGLDNSSATGAHLTLNTYADGRLVSTVDSRIGQAVPISVNVVGTQRLKIEAIATPDSQGCFTAVWGDARLTK